MNWTRGQLKSNAKLMIKKNWLSCALVSLIVALFAGSGGLDFNFKTDSSELEQVASNVGGDWSYWLLQILPFLAGLTVLIVIAAILLQFFVGNPLKVGGARFYLHNIHSQGQMDDIGFAFKYQYINVVIVMFMRDLYVFLFSLLLVIPGIIKHYQYILVPFLLADNPELSHKEALQLSSDMMYGEKMNYFVLQLSFILWQILSSITAGIVGIFWVNPYVDATNAEFYTAVKTRWEEQNASAYAQY